MFSTYSFSHFSGSFSTNYNPYLVDISSIGNLDISKCKDLCSMFNGCKNIKIFDCLKIWNVSNCLNFESIFTYCNFTNVNFILSWNIKNDTDLGGAFYGCEKTK